MLFNRIKYDIKEALGDVLFEKLLIILLTLNYWIIYSFLWAPTSCLLTVDCWSLLDLVWIFDSAFFGNDYTIGVFFFFLLQHSPPTTITILIIISVFFCWLRLVNGFIEFDQKLMMFSTKFLVHQRLLSKKCWDITLISFFMYFIVYIIYELYFWPPHTLDISTIALYFFSMPYIMDFTVIISAIFYLVNLGCRFRTLIGFWKCFPPGLVAIPGKWTHLEITMLVEYIRLLHAEMSEMSKMFSLGYGPILLGFFVFSFIDMIYFFFLIIYYLSSYTEVQFIKHVIKYFFVHIFKVQNIIFMMSIIIAVSWINDEVRTNVIKIITITILD